jgi:hypothetical protein
MDNQLNVFQLWDQRGRELPLRVVKETWAHVPEHYFLVEQIEIGKWPYGTAWGRYCRDGNIGSYEKLRNSGTFTWHLYNAEPSL